jgi:hypothetical protein
MRNIWDKFVEKLKKISLCSVRFSENRDVHEIVWKNMAEPDSLQVAI